MIAAITRVMKEDEEDRAYIRPVSRLLIMAGICILFIPFFAGWLKTVSILTISAIILFVPVLVGIRSWVFFKFSGSKD
jgi:hypothetical protein